MKAKHKSYDWTEIDKLHKVAHDFDKRFRNVETGEFILSGYDLMCAVEKWAKKYPKDVEIVRCDDSTFMCSDIVLIQHKNGDDFMGTTMITISQNGDHPAVMFLYPKNSDDLIEALNKGKTYDEWVKYKFGKD